MPSCVNPNHKFERQCVDAHRRTKLIKFSRLIRLFVSLTVDVEIHLEEQETNDSPFYRSTNQNYSIRRNLSNAVDSNDLKFHADFPYYALGRIER